MEAGAEFGGLLSSENTYLDVLIQETKDAGYDWTRLEPHQKRDFKEIVQEKYAKNKEGLARMVGNAFGRSSESIDSPYQIIQQERIDSQKRYLTYLERGYKNDRLDFYDKVLLFHKAIHLQMIIHLKKQMKTYLP